MVLLPLSAKGIERVEMPNILLGKSPERESYRRGALGPAQATASPD
jgi:hypothetical protein